MEGMDTRVARAYIAPENFDQPLRYSGYVEQSNGSPEFSPTFESLAEALDWARERTDFVIARGVAGPYYWYGVGQPPPGLMAPPE